MTAAIEYAFAHYAVSCLVGFALLLCLYSLTAAALNNWHSTDDLDETADKLGQAVVNHEQRNGRWN